jgi:SagB-type dehydrogenase family enzyme
VSACGEAARAYHDATKHSWQSVRSGHHVLDWEIKPFPFKLYPDVPTLALPREVAPPALPALEALARVTAPAGLGALGLAALAQVLFFVAGLTKKKVYPGGEAIHFRAAASTGALYEVELYVVAGSLPGLDPAVYHFCPGDFALRRLRAGDHRGVLAEAAGEPERVRRAPATLVLTAIYWRNTWKYQARAFRHFFWDAGTLSANLLATAAAADLDIRLLLGFADAEVNRLLGLDPRHEGALVLAPLGSGAPDTEGRQATLPVESLELRTVPLSSREVDYPLVREAYRASSLDSGAAARAWAHRDARPAEGAPTASPVDHALAPRGEPTGRSLGDVILRRGSTRQFARDVISFAALSTILDAAVRDLPLDAATPGLRLVDVYLLAHAIEGIPPGAYVYDPGARGLRLLRAGEFRPEGGYLCLEQALGADASAVVFFLSDLGRVLDTYGARGYRVANFAAGLLGGRMYLAAYALGLGASGLTFYDDDVVRFFAPDATGKDAVFVTALGRAFRDTRRRGLAQAEGQVHRLAPGQA